MDAPLLASADELLITDVMRLAAAAGVVAAVARDPAEALRSWNSAPVVLVGADLSGPLSLTGPVRRPRVHVLGRGPIPDGIFREALMLGAETVAELPRSETWLVETLTDVGDGAAQPGSTVGVLGGSGGVGATVFAAAVAQSAAAVGRALLVDADPLGAGIERVLGFEQVPGVRWDAMMQATGRLSARSLREALPRRDSLSVLAWPPDRTGSLQAFAMREVLSAGRRGFDCVVVDLPRHSDPVVDEVLSRCDDVVLVSGLTVSAVSAAARVVGRLPNGAVPHLVTRGGHTGVPPEEVAALLGLPLLAVMGDQRGLDEAVNLGVGPLRSRRGPLARAARECVDRLLVDRSAAA